MKKKIAILIEVRPRAAISVGAFPKHSSEPPTMLCDYCNQPSRPGIAILTCGYCHIALYCSVVCQNEAWVNGKHHHACLGFKQHLVPARERMPQSDDDDDSPPYASASEAAGDAIENPRTTPSATHASTDPVRVLPSPESINCATHDALMSPVDEFEGPWMPEDLYIKPPNKPCMKRMYFMASDVFDPTHPGRKFLIADESGHGVEETSQFWISYYVMGARSLPGQPSNDMMMLHGVPMSKREYRELAIRYLQAFYYMVIWDMLGMGQSAKIVPRNEEERQLLKWKYQAKIMNMLADLEFGEGKKYASVATDWGTGIQNQHAAEHWRRLTAIIKLNGIETSGHPVWEIGGFALASQKRLDMRDGVLEGRVPYAEGSFQEAMVGFRGTLMQILESMSSKTDTKSNQWTRRLVLETYTDVRWEEPGATPLTMKVKWPALYAMAKIASMLSPDQTMPLVPGIRPGGVDYAGIRDVPILVLNSGGDKMMPALQGRLFPYLMPHARVFSDIVEGAGHFILIDRPVQVAEKIIAWWLGIFGVDSLPEIFLGFGGVFKGNERSVVEVFRQLYTDRFQTATALVDDDWG